MNPEHWQRAEQLCEAALELPPSERPAFLEKSCGDDTSFRQQVEALIDGHDCPDDFLLRPAMEVAARSMASKAAGLFAGQTFGQYNVLSLLGAGGMGEVYRAHDAKLQRDVAIKILSETSFKEGPSNSRLVREARLAAALNHPHICSIFEVGETDGMAYIAMELIEGEPLNLVIPAEGLTADQVLNFGLQIADAVGYAHEKGVMHRDLKSANTLIANQRHVKVLDFGLAKRINSQQLSEASSGSTTYLSGTGTLVGTLPYMAPEQFRGRAADTRTDVWALGVILYEMATGKRPFVGQTVFELSSAVLTHDPQFPANHDRGLTPLIPIIQRCLKKEPEERFANGNEVRIALELTRTAPILLPSLPGQDSAKSRHRYYIVAIAASLLLLAGLSYKIGIFSKSPDVWGSPHALTSYSGWEIAPSWNLDRSLIAYTRVDVSSADIAILTPGGAPRILTADSPADEFQPSFSPSGTKIVYVSDRGTGTDIYWKPTTEGPEQKVASTHIPFLQRMGAWASALGSNAWSRDETEIVFSRLMPTGEVALWKVKVTGQKAGQEKQLTKPLLGAEDSYPAWSPDGKTIAFTRGGTLMTIPADGGNPTPVLEKGRVGNMPAWLPNSRGLVYVGEDKDLWEVEFGQAPYKVTNGAAADSHIMAPTVSHDGNYIAYSTYDHNVDVYWAELVPGRRDDTNDIQLTFSSKEQFAPRISPAESNKVLYASNRTDNYELYLFDRNTQIDRPLTHDDANDRLADWSPKGDEIVYMSDHGGQINIWILNTETGMPRQLTTQPLSWADNPEAEGGPRWSPDGKLIAYIAPSANGNAIWVVDRDGRNPRATSIRGAFSFSWYRDSDRLIYSKQTPDGHQELWATNIRTSEEIQLPAGHIAEVAVSPDGRQLSFLNSLSHFTMNLFAVGLTEGPDKLPHFDGEPHPITFEKGAHVHAGGFSRDGKAVVYSRDKDRGDIFILEKKK